MGNQVVIITGAGSGLGASIAKKYSENGAHICLLGRTENKLREIGKQLPNNYSIHTVDVSEHEDVKRVFDTIIQTYGKVDILFNNAGVGIFDLAEELTEEAVHNMIDINLKGTIFCSQEVLKQMKKQDSGTIVNIVSTAGLIGKATESVYCASKFGVKGFTESLVVELTGTPISVFAAYMGGMNTDFWAGIFDEDKTSKMMNPDDIAEIIIENIKPRKNISIPEIIIKNIK
ncbi:SDR family oxidoreductase [Gottfriedia acidiceleris]|uniref:SDR family oxidoreductase n=1 Tax=Gottfriedia acidiceleris TaxID=371036 RepID=A0ABY4JF81_9BACI|nr:SDR family oxidoreductase [Gottfriedia acidiceleris]UPM52497.1 SDR family oxidoreductase [Gottfriedia acidiceleris]